MREVHTREGRRTEVIAALRTVVGLTIPSRVRGNVLPFLGLLLLRRLLEHLLEELELGESGGEEGEKNEKEVRNGRTVHGLGC